MPRWTAEDIADDGERVSHLQPDFLYFAHLSIYRYAAPLVRSATVIDVGCGSGYGTACLAEGGATSVLGLDASTNAIAFCQHHFARSNLTFRRCPAERVGDLDAPRVDVVFSSNVLEHVTGIGHFFHGVHSRMRPGSTLLVAVPPITNDHLLYENLVNPYHVNLWSPRQWHATLERYFQHVTPVLHGVRTIGTGPTLEDLASRSLDGPPFVFAEAALDDFYATPSLTAIFVARGPRLDGIPDADAPIEFVDDSFSRPPGVIDPELVKRLRAVAPSFRTRVVNRLSRAYVVWKAGGVGAVRSRSLAALGRRRPARGWPPRRDPS